MDLLAIGAHPDDCELFAGGLLAELCLRGYSIGVCDLTRGEAASRGTPEIRAEEAERSGAILGLAKRTALDLGDAGLENTSGSRRAVVEALRRLRPLAVLTHHQADRHPDHTRAHHLVREACFYATVGGFDAVGERLTAEPALFYFFGNCSPGDLTPDFIVPLSEESRRIKHEALAAYSSQFFNPEQSEAPTMISSRDYAEAMAARERMLGQSVGAQWGEPFALERPAGIADPLSQLFGLGKKRGQNTN